MLLRCWDNVRVDVSSSNTGCGFEGWSLIRSRFVVTGISGSASSQNGYRRIAHNSSPATDLCWSNSICLLSCKFAAMIAIHLTSWKCQWVLARPTLTGTCWLQGGLRTSANRHSNDVRGSQGLVSYVTAGHGIKLPMLGNRSGSVTVAELEELIRLPTHPLFWTLRHSIYDTPANCRCFASCWER